MARLYGVPSRSSFNPDASESRAAGVPTPTRKSLSVRGRSPQWTVRGCVVDMQVGESKVRARAQALHCHIELTLGGGQGLGIEACWKTLRAEKVPLLSEASSTDCHDFRYCNLFLLGGQAIAAPPCIALHDTQGHPHHPAHHVRR